MTAAAARTRPAAAAPETAGALIADAAARFADAGIATARLDARLLAADAFGVDMARLIARPELRPTPARARRFRALATRRARREPVAYILGRREFWSLGFRLGPATLVPRPETETVVEAALAGIADRDAGISILDLGTGSGCILLALLSELARARGLGVDLSAPALALARANARALGLAGRARFKRSDWGRGVAGRFDLVVANPPYVADGDFAGLDAEVRCFEPRRALAGGADGLDAYRALVPDLPRLLKPGGSAVIEIGADQADAVAAMLGREGLAVSGVRADLAGRPRAISAMAKF